MMETEDTSEKLVFSLKLSRLMARENFSTFISRESFRYLDECRLLPFSAKLCVATYGLGQ
jgi:hypothetical protein